MTKAGGGGRGPEHPRVGWIGTGRMGSAMVGRLLDAGLDLTVYNRTRSKTVPLIERGARVVDAPQELADRDFVFTMVSSSSDLESVILGDSGLLADPVRAPRIVVDCSTVSAETSALVRAEVARRGGAFLAAPVSGNPGVVASGDMTAAVSGDRESYELARPVLAVLGRSVHYVGEDETARLVKIAHNMILGILMQALSEAAVLVEKSGVDRRAFLDFLNDSVVGSRFTGYKAQALVDADFAPTFTTALMLKDFDLGLEAADRAAVPLLVTSLVRQLTAQAVGAGRAEQDFASVVLEVARAAGLDFRPSPSA